MAADAALRAGLQVVRAIGAAAFFNLTHRAIQPSNLMIVPGQSPDGGWPFVKLLNLGLAGLELHSDSSKARELAPSISPQFASPEQRANGEIDFRSEMYSLGATLCFLLTGAAPLAVSGMKARLRIRRLPELRRAPKVLHNLLVYLLRENPENRPHDPVALEHQMRDCLSKIERRQAIGRKLGIPLAAVIPKKSKQPATPLAQPNNVAPVPPNQSKSNASPAIAAANPNALPDVEQTKTSKASAPEAATTPVTASTAAQIASVSQQPEPTPSVAGSNKPPSAAENSEQFYSTQSSESTVRSKKKTVASNRTSTSRSARINRALPYEDDYGAVCNYQSR